MRKAHFENPICLKVTKMSGTGRCPAQGHCAFLQIPIPSRQQKLFLVATAKSFFLNHMKLQMTSMMLDWDASVNVSARSGGAGYVQPTSVRPEL